MAKNDMEVIMYKILRYLIFRKAIGARSLQRL